MADETPPPPGAAGQPRRPGPTIDLKATEIAREAPPAAEQAAPPEESTAPAQPSAPKPPPRSAPQPGGQRGIISWPVVAAGVAGAVLTLGAVWIVLLTTDRSSELAAADARIATLERTVAGAASTNSAASDDLASRLQKLETQAAAPRAPATDPALANRIAGLEAQLKAVGEASEALGRRADSTAAANATALRELGDKLARSGDAVAQSNEASSEATSANATQISGLTARIDALDGNIKKLADGTQARLTDLLAKDDAARAEDQALRTAVVAGALATAVARGTPFAEELAVAQKQLAAAQTQAADTSKLAPLTPFAAGGIGDAVGLGHELEALAPALRQAATTTPATGSFLEKLSANAQRLVRITPIDEVPGDDPAAVVARLEAKASRGDIEGTLAEFDKLAPAARAPAQDWIAKAQARQAALAASRAFASDALAAVGEH